MGTSPKSAAVVTRRESLKGAPRTAATARVREVWDCRLRESERELVFELMALPPQRIVDLSGCRWSDFDAALQARILIALRDLVTLGNEASYALGYSRRNG